MHYLRFELEIWCCDKSHVSTGYQTAADMSNLCFAMNPASCIRSRPTRSGWLIRCPGVWRAEQVTPLQSKQPNHIHMGPMNLCLPYVVRFDSMALCSTSFVRFLISWNLGKSRLKMTKKMLNNGKIIRLPIVHHWSIFTSFAGVSPFFWIAFRACLGQNLHYQHHCKRIRLPTSQKLVSF